MNECTTLVAAALLLLISSAGLCAAQANPQAGGYIARAGKAGCVLVVPEDASGSETYAAQELKDHIKQITGVDLTIFKESSYSAGSGACVSIGRTALSRKYISDEQIQALGDDGYRVFSRNGNTFFVGGRKRGSMYAVYQYLESLGVRWYSPDFTLVPKMADVKMPAKPFEGKPSFWYRDQWWNNAPTPEWLARMRVNGNNGQVPRLPESKGGSAVTQHGCHSFHILVPANEYLDKHPEWFALKEDGKRSGGELCLTNPELREFVTQRVLTDLRAVSGQINNYWVSQNDGGSSACFCDKCTQERLAHGGKDRWSANIISFTSCVADKVKQEFPRVFIKTLAYTYTQAPPENLIASDNVLVEICGNFKEGDTSHTGLVESWSKVAKNISVYTYGGSNYGYWWPYPNVWDVGMQYPRAYKSGVRAFYIQGTALGKGSGLVDIKAYVSARLAWDASRDVNKEIRNFCNGFYGSGGKYIVEYLDWYSNYIKQHNMVMDGGWGNAERWRDWVTKEAMLHCDDLFQKAIAATRDNPAHLNHVRRAYLEVLWGRVMIDVQPKTTDITAKDLALQPGVDASAVQERAKLFGAIMRENGYNMMSEVVPFDAAAYPH